MKTLGALFGFKKSGRVVHGWMVGIAVFLLSIPGDAFAVGGTLTVTPSAVSVSNATPTVDVTLSLSVPEATQLHSAGLLLQWDAYVFALDASSSGTQGNNDPHQTSYLTGNDGTKKSDENDQISHVWAVGDSDTMELRISNDDTGADKLFDVSGQAYINYTRTDSLSLSETDASQMFKITLKMKSGASDGSSAIKATMIAVSDDKGSVHTDYTQGSVMVGVPVTDIIYTWASLTRPDGVDTASVNIIQATPSLPSATFMAAVAGEYTFSLTTTDRISDSVSSDTRVVVVPAAPATVPGDVSPSEVPDENVDVNDAVEILRMVLGIRADKPKEADVSPFGSPDGKVDVNDAVVILQRVLGIVGEIAVDGNRVHSLPLQF